MAIAFDTAAASSSWLTSSSSTSFSYTTSGSNRFLVVGVESYSSSLRTVSSMTYNGVSLTKITSNSANLTGNFQGTELWYVDNAASGSNTLAITLSGAADFWAYHVASYTGKTSTGIDASHAAQDLAGSTFSPTNNVTVVASDCWLVGIAYSRDGSTPSAGAGTTRRASALVGHAIGDSNGLVGTGTQTLAWTTSGADYWPGVIYASISAGSGGGATRPNPARRQLLGVG